jgi:hypothetical protein
MGNKWVAPNPIDNSLSETTFIAVGFTNYAKLNITCNNSLVQNKFLTAEPPRAQRSIFLFGGEIPPNKKPSHQTEMMILSSPEASKRSLNAISKARGVLIRSPSPDQIRKKSPSALSAAPR